MTVCPFGLGVIREERRATDRHLGSANDCIIRGHVEACMPLQCSRRKLPPFRPEHHGLFSVPLCRPVVVLSQNHQPGHASSGWPAGSALTTMLQGLVGRAHISMTRGFGSQTENRRSRSASISHPSAAPLQRGARTRSLLIRLAS